MIVEQGDIITVEGLIGNYLVTSKNFFNKTEQAMLCPIVKDTFIDPLHIEIKLDNIKGIVLCEHIRLVDLKHRGFSMINRIHYADIIDVTDAIQSIFDY